MTQHRESALGKAVLLVVSLATAILLFAPLLVLLVFVPALALPIAAAFAPVLLSRFAAKAVGPALRADSTGELREAVGAGETPEEVLA